MAVDVDEPLHAATVAAASHRTTRTRAAAEGSGKQAVAAELGLGRADGERAAKVAREPDVHHLAALERPRARGAPSVVLRPSAALVPDGADDVRVPARDRPPPATALALAAARCTSPRRAPR